MNYDSSTNGANCLTIKLVDLSGETNIRYTPLAILGIKAILENDSEIIDSVDVSLVDFLQSHTVAEMVDQITKDKPEIIGMSCQGWNMRQLQQTFSTIKQLLPTSLLILGGNHVSHRGSDILRIHPEIDFIVNGEGEFAFLDLVKAYLNDEPDFFQVKGLTYRTENGIASSEERPKTREMAKLPSPYLYAGVDLSVYDVALLETNRGCPYKCAFCYWGGRIGQKMALGELDRIQNDITAIAKAGIETVFLCDANFGILKQDVEVAKMIVEANIKYGAPREFNVNWAKNNAERVGEIINILLDGGIHTVINVPIQTLSLTALEMANRNETGRSQMMEQAETLVAQGCEVFCELIFALPGETYTEFLKNYDDLIFKFPVLRIHPLWVLPNTAYDKRRAELDIKTISPDPYSDYEAIYSHLSMTNEDIRNGLAFLMAHSNFNLLGIGRNVLRACARFSDLSPSEVLLKFESFIMNDKAPLAKDLSVLYKTIRRACYFERNLRDKERQLLYRSRSEAFELVTSFILSLKFSEELVRICSELALFDASLLPRADLTGEGFVESQVEFSFDPVGASLKIQLDDECTIGELIELPETQITLSHKAGMAVLEGSNCDLTGSWNGRVAEVTQHAADFKIVAA